MYTVIILPFFFLILQKLYTFYFSGHFTETNTTDTVERSNDCGLSCLVQSEDWGKVLDISILCILLAAGF